MDVNAAGQGGQNSKFIYTNSYSIGNVSSNSENNNTVINTNNNQAGANSKVEGITEKEAKKATEKFNKLLEDKETHVEYDVDKNFKNVMIMKVIDNNTNKVINEIPSKQILDMVAEFCQLAGILVDKKA